MNQTVLVCDNSSVFARDLSVSLRDCGASVFMLAPPEQTDVSNASVQANFSNDVLVWNKPSPLSAKTIKVSLKNRCEGQCQAVFVFDGPDLVRAINAKRKASGSELSSKVDNAAFLDEFIRGYFLLVSEILELFREKKGGRFVFILNPVDTASGIESSPETLVVALIESAFIRLADEIAKDITLAGIPALQAMLIKLENTESIETLPWTVERIVSYGAERSGTRWIKSGSKGLFGKF